MRRLPLTIASGPDGRADFLRLKDDRGATRPAYMAEGRASDPQQRSDLSAAEFEQLQHDLRGEATTWFVDMTSWKWYVLIGPFYLLITVVGITAVAAGRAKWHTALGTIGSAAFIAWLFFTRRHRVPNLDAWTKGNALKKRGRCGSCAYLISGLSPDPDGCTVCPECGAAWRLPASEESPQ